MNISILIPVYGSHKLAMKSILSAIKYESIKEIIVCDDNPKNPLLSSYPNIQSQFQNLTYILNEKNLGRSKNYKKLLSLNKTELFIMLDGDDHLFNDINFEIILKQFEKNTNLVISCGVCKEIKDNKIFKVNSPRLKGTFNGKYYFLKWINTRNILPHSACVIRQTAVKKSLGYDIDVINTDIIMLRSLLLFGDILIHNQHISNWIYHGNNASIATNTDLLSLNFKTIIDPYNVASQSKGIFFRLRLWFWFIVNYNLLFVSILHQFLGQNLVNPFKMIFNFYFKVFGLYKSNKLLAFLGILTSIPKVLLILIVNKIIGNKNFSILMSRRGNYLYFD